MHKKIIALLLSLSVISCTSAYAKQFPKESAGLVSLGENKNISKKKAISLKSRDIVIRKEEFNVDFSAKSKKEVYVKLKKGLKTSESNSLERNNICIKQFVGSNTYIMEVDENQLQLLKRNSFIEGFAEVLPNDKITKRLKKASLPEYVVDGSYVNVVVSFYKGISYKDATAIIKGVGGRKISKKMSFTNRLKASIPYNALEDLASDTAVEYVEEIAPPIAVNNINAGKLSKVFWEHDNDDLTGLFDPDGDYAYTGDGVNVAVEDEGSIIHPDFATGQIQIIDYYFFLPLPPYSFLGKHSTHVAGTIGLPINTPANRGGMAPSCTIFSYSFQDETDYLDDFVSAIDEYDAPIINNSWGTSIGYQEINNYGLPSSWEWYGNQELFGNYNYMSQDMDEFMAAYYHKNAVLVKSVGNDRDDSGDGYFSYPHDGTWYYDNDSMRIGYYDCIPPGSCAKNIITVGAVGTEESDCDSSSFSSWGPTDDGRIKPDVVADGYELNSTIATDVDEFGYDTKSGTSMSAPVVTGVIALIFEAYKGYYNVYPTADIVKSLICNFAIDAGRLGPDPSYGYGIVDAKTVIDIIDSSYTSPTGGHILQGHILETGDELEYTLNFNSSNDPELPLKITLAWIDVAGSMLNTKQLVNDLDLLVYESDNESNCFYPYYLDNDGVPPTLNAKNDAPNHVDNVEQVVIPYSSLRDGDYTVKVSGYNLGRLNQNFAISASLLFDGFHFNNLSVWDENKDAWVSHEKILLENTPDFRLQISLLDNDTFDTSSLKYQYSNSVDNDGDPVWNGTWLDVSGVYEDEGCTITCNTNYTGNILYARINNVPFSQAGIDKNKIKFTAEYQSTTYYSSAYLFRNYNIFYVDNDGSANGDGSVSNPWSSINRAISFLGSIIDNDTEVDLRINGGIYNEDIALSDHINIYGSYDNEGTVINGSGNGPVIIGADNVVLDGLTITGGEARYGGGMFFESCSDVEIRNCTIDDNGIIADHYDPFYLPKNVAYGGGLYAYESTLKIVDTTFSNNYGSSSDAINAYLHGAGCYVANSTVTFENCTFENNTSAGTGAGAKTYGIALCTDASETRIINCLFKNNTSTTAATYGGAIYTIDVYANNFTDILGSCFYGNEADLGGAILIYGLPATLTNCTIFNNIANNGGGIYRVAYNASMTVTNCILWANSDDYYCIQTPPTTVTYTCSEYNFSGTGNINTDPLLVSEDTGDYHLSPASPCINAGLNTASGISYLETDIDGEDRIDESSDVCDMGVDEVYDIYYVSASSGSDQNAGTRAYPWATIDHAIDTIQSSSSAYEIVMVESGTYNEYISIPAGMTLIGGHDSSWNYDPDTNVTTLTTSTSNSIVQMAEDSAIYGFTITGGDAVLGAGIKITAITSEGNIGIEDCVITGNTADYYGGGIHIRDCKADVYIANCLISNNVAEQIFGGGINLLNNDPATYTGTVYIRDSAISNNLAVTGGGLRAYDQTVELDNCDIVYNVAKRGDAVNNYVQGGGISFLNSGVSMINCEVKYNECEGNGVDSSSSSYFISGGGINIVGGEATITSCLIEDNICKTTNDYGEVRGGGIFVSSVYDGCIISDSIIDSNTLDTPYEAYGGAIWSNDSDLDVYTSVIFNNSVSNAATAQGISFYINKTYYDYQVSVVNCTIYNNTASLATSSIENTTPTSVSIANSILWNNDDEINGSATISYTCIEDGDTGTSVTHSNPLFMDAGNGDLHISTNSPCKDTGDNSALNTTTYAYDIDGEDRVVNTTIDMGVDEFLDTDNDGTPDYCE